MRLTFKSVGQWFCDKDMNTMDDDKLSISVHMKMPVCVVLEERLGAAQADGMLMQGETDMGSQHNPCTKDMRAQPH